MMMWSKIFENAKCFEFRALFVQFASRSVELPSLFDGGFGINSVTSVHRFHAKVVKCF